MSHYIYKIWSQKGDKVYYGSTDNFNKRIYGHKTDHKRGHYVSSQELFNEYGIENCLFQIIEECNKDNKLIREKWYIENNLCVNKTLPIENEYQPHPRVLVNHITEDKRKEKAEYDQQYRKSNKDKRDLQVDCECGGYYVQRHKTTHYKTKRHAEYAKK